MAEITLKAPDISCDHCIKSIEKAVSGLPSVRFIGGDPETKKVTVDYDPALVELSVIEGAMEEEGYPVSK
jgi:copper chaperone